MTNFTKLWAGQTISLLGSALTTFALPTLAVLVLHATPTELGLLAAMETLPFPILGVFVGVLADRWPRRRIMIIADLTRCVFLATIPIAATLGRLNLDLFYVVGLASGIGSAFFGITYQSYLPELVAKERLMDANMKLEFSNSGANMAGSALGGVLVQFVGAVAAIGIDASLSHIRATRTKHRGPALSPRQLLHEIGEGLHIIWHSSDLRWIAAATATTNFGGAMISVVALLYAYRILHVQPGLLGVVSGFAELGFVGALLSPRIRDRFGLRATLVGSLVLSAIGAGCTLLAQIMAPYVVLFIGAAISAICVPIYNINQVSYRQALIDVSLAGRVNATIRTFIWGTLPLGSLAGGYLAAWTDAPRTIFVGSVIAGLAALWLLPIREGRFDEVASAHP
jgi:MFS family permease